MDEKEDLGIKLGSEDMLFWQEVINGKSADVEITQRNLKLFESILEMAKLKYKEAEEEFKKCM